MSRMRGANKAVKIFLAGLERKVCRGSSQAVVDVLLERGFENIYALSSFYSINPRYSQYIPLFKDFLLDSGAFSFMKKGQDNINWNKYLEKYIAFINENKIKNFFELDIDSIVGYEKVKEFRFRLERETGRQSIPVWHYSRGLEEYYRLCEEYSYIAIGDIAIRNIKVDDYKYFPFLISEAHKRKSKVHGLGITASSIIKKYHFDTVDSSSWSGGSRFGSLYFFRNGELIARKRQKGLRIKDWITADIHNLKEFFKYQEYAETHL